MNTESEAKLVEPNTGQVHPQDQKTQPNTGQIYPQGQKTQDENRLVPKPDTWNETIRDLIKHENDLVAQRLGWMGAFQGLLFTALAFSWEKGGRWLSPTTVLCVMGIFLAWQSLRALLQSSSAIDKLLESWCEHIEVVKKSSLPTVNSLNLQEHKPHRRVFFHSFIDPNSLGLPSPLDLPPVWAWNDPLKDTSKNLVYPHWLVRCLKWLKTKYLWLKTKYLWLTKRLKRDHTAEERDHTAEEKDWRQGWFKAPWHWVPICLLLGWAFILWFHLARLEPLRGQWQSLVQDELKQALVHDKSDKEAQQAITTLALIHGNADDGKRVFKRVRCASCHALSSQGGDQAIPSRDKLGEYDRKKIVSGILYPSPKEITREGKKICMVDGLATLMSPEEFSDVVEYLKPLSEAENLL